jgi:hypothetical protein
MLEYCLEEVCRSCDDLKSARKCIQLRIPLIVASIPTRFLDVEFDP